MRCSAPGWVKTFQTSAGSRRLGKGSCGGSAVDHEAVADGEPGVGGGEPRDGGGGFGDGAGPARGRGSCEALVAVGFGFGRPRVADGERWPSLTPGAGETAKTTGRLPEEFMVCGGRPR